MSPTEPRHILDVKQWVKKAHLHSQGYRIHAQLICDTHMTRSVEQVCTRKLSRYTQQTRSWPVCWGLHTCTVYTGGPVLMEMYINRIFTSAQDPCSLGRRGRSREERGEQREAAASSSAPRSCWSCWGRRGWLRHTNIEHWPAGLGKGESPCLLWPLSWAEAKQMHLSQQLQGAAPVRRRGDISPAFAML